MTAGRSAALFTAGGIRIDWQAGPTRSNDSPIPPNGAFVEDAILAAKARLLFFQEGPFACKENAKALHHVMKALMALQKRTKDRRKRGVLGPQRRIVALAARYVLG